MGLYSVSYLTAEWVSNLSRPSAVGKADKVNALNRDTKGQQKQAHSEKEQANEEDTTEVDGKEAWLQELLSQTGLQEKTRLTQEAESLPQEEPHHAYSLSFNKAQHLVELTHKASGKVVLTLKEDEFARMVASIKQALPQPAGVFTDYSC
jgi:hypothetical protein